MMSALWRAARNSGYFRVVAAGEIAKSRLLNTPGVLRIESLFQEIENHLGDGKVAGVSRGLGNASLFGNQAPHVGNDFGALLGIGLGHHQLAKIVMLDVLNCGHKFQGPPLKAVLPTGRIEGKISGESLIADPLPLSTFDPVAGYPIQVGDSGDNWGRQFSPSTVTVRKALLPAGLYPVEKHDLSSRGGIFA
jgi:hypothetical protein